MIDFKSKVKIACRLRNIQQKELAAKLGITDIGLSANLKKNNPRLDTMENIASALDMSLIDLLTLEPDTQEAKQPDIVEEKPVEMSGGAMRCPHCGEKIEIFVKAI